MKPLQCTKCSAPGHHNSACQVPWPEKDQICDVCYEQHEMKSCKQAKKNGDFECNFCGHDHIAKSCPIQAPTEANIAQYTATYKVKGKARKEKEDKKNAALLAKVNNATAQSGSEDTAKAQAAMGSLSLGDGGQSSTAQGMQQERVPPIDFDKKDKWAETGRQLPPPPAEKQIKAQPISVKTNFFKLSLNTDVELRKYAILLDKIDGRTPTKRETKEYLVNQILTENPPNAVPWVCDYNSWIISVGRLYDEDGDDLDTSTTKQYTRTGLPGKPEPPIMNGQIVFKGFVRLRDLQRHLRDPTLQFAEDDIRALNMIVWKSLYTNFDGRLAGRNFFPRVPFNTIHFKPRPSEPVVYETRQGFYSSVRPGINSLFLNLNTSTSAFFPEQNLADWIQFSRPRDEDLRVLQGARVVVKDDPAAKVRVISGFSTVSIGEQTFKDNTSGRYVTVYDHWRNSKSTSNACFKFELMLILPPP